MKVVRTLWLLAVVMPSLASAQTITALTAEWKKADGYLTFYTHPQSTKVLLEVDRLGQDFLYGVALAQGAGFAEPLMGRGELDGLRLCRFERFANRVFLVHRSSRFREGTFGEGSLALQESFAQSVIASFDIEAEEDGRTLIDVAPFLLKDQQVRPWMPKGWEADLSRSAVLIERSGAYPRNTDFETLVTLSGDGDAATPFADALADPHSMTLRLRHSFLELPRPGFEARVADPRVGFFGSTFTDVNAPNGQPLPQTLAARWRLVKKDPQAAVSEPIEPIVLHLDPAIPTQYLDAVRRGALWWNHALEAAGFREAISLRDLPAGATFADVRFSGIQWVHRASGEISLGQIQSDPRTAEIVHAVVSLDSASPRTTSGSLNRPMFLGAQACALTLEPRPIWDIEEALAQEELAWVTAHEVGHILGLTHNMAASSYRGSVMDYLPADLKLAGDRIVTAGAYPNSVGPYDDMAIRWAYTPGRSAPGLEAIVREGIGRGVVFPQTDDSRWAKWDLGPDPVDYLLQRLELRQVLLSQLADGAVRDGEPMQRLYQRFESTFRLHEQAVAAAAQQVGGVLMPQTVKGDGQRPFEWVPGAQQRRALKAVLATLSPENLRVPAGLEPLLLPGPAGSEPTRFSSEAGLAFSPVGHGRDAADRILDSLLMDDSRLARLTMASRSGGIPLDEVLTALVEHAWRPQPGSDHQEQALVRAVQERVVDKLLVIARVGKPSEVRGVALDHLTRLRRRVGASPTFDAEARAHRKLLQRQIDEFLFRGPQQGAN